MTSDIVEKLRKALDLTLYEARLYIALLQGASNPREASALSGVPLPRIYDVVRVLEAKGLAMEDPKGWYKPLSPRAVATAMIARIEEESRRRASLILEVADRLEELAYERGEEPGTASVRNSYAVISALVDSMREADRIYMTVIDTLVRHKIIVKKLVDSLATIVGDIRILIPPATSIEGLELHIESGIVKVKEHRHILVDLVASKHNYMILAEDPLDKVPVGLMVKSRRENRVFARLNDLWNSI